MPAICRQSPCLDLRTVFHTFVIEIFSNFAFAGCMLRVMTWNPRGASRGSVCSLLCQKPLQILKDCTDFVWFPEPVKVCLQFWLIFTFNCRISMIHFSRLFLDGGRPDRYGFCVGGVGGGFTHRLMPFTDGYKRFRPWKSAFFLGFPKTRVAPWFQWTAF